MEKITGIIVEYNPLHKGHGHHIEQAKGLTRCDAVVAAMSGDFVQRGEPAIVDKRARAEMALGAGVNLVIEIPAVYAIQDAKGFALGSVGVLERMGVITDLVFGSESGNLDELDRLADILHHPDDALLEKQRSYMKSGFSFPNARKKALAALSRGEETTPEATLALSNNILAVEYLKALRHYNSGIKPATIRREGAQYTDLTQNERFSSASAIRKWIREDRNDLVEGAMPSQAYRILAQEIGHQRGPAFLDAFGAFLIPFLRARNRDHLKRYSGVVEGLDLRFVESAKGVNTIPELLDAVKTKRFTYAKLRRILLYMLFEIEDEIIQESNAYGPQYIRVLGFDSVGQVVLKRLRSRSRLPVLSIGSAYLKMARHLEKPRVTERLDTTFRYALFRKQIELNFRMTDFYRTAFFTQNERPVMDIQTPPVRLLEI